jgi:hypothetical protein
MHVVFVYVLGHIVAVDSVSPTVFCIAESGDLIRWFDCSDYMREPSDIAISGKEYFVCDFKVSCHSLQSLHVTSDSSAVVRFGFCSAIIIKGGRIEARRYDATSCDELQFGLRVRQVFVHAVALVRCIEELTGR